MSISIPHLFRCPISLDLFTDPVTLSTGQTYDRPSIERWLAGGNLTCPITMQPLHDATLVPNTTLRQLIHQWLLSSLHHDLDGDPIRKLEMLRKTRTLSVESETERNCLMKMGFLQLLLRMVFAGDRRITKDVVAEEEAVEVALDCILSLSSSTQMGCFKMLEEESMMSTFAELLYGGSVRIKISVCDIITCIANSPITTELCLAIGRNRHILRDLVSLLGVGTSSEAAAKALSALCLQEENRVAAVEEGVVEGIVAYLSASSCGCGVAVSAVEQLARLESGKAALLRSGNGIRVMVKMVFRVLPRDGAGSEHAVGCLWLVCRESARARAEAVDAGVFSQLLLLLQSQCGGKAKAKARALLKLLRVHSVRI